MSKILPLRKILGILAIGFLVMAFACPASAADIGNDVQRYKAVWTVSYTQVVDGKTIVESKTITQIRTIWTVEDNLWFKISAETIDQDNRRVGEREYISFKDASFPVSEYNRSVAAGRLYEDANLTQMNLITSAYNETMFEDLLEENIGAPGPLTFPAYAPEWVKPPYLK